MQNSINALDLGLNAAVLHIAAKVTKGFKVSANAPTTYEGLLEDVARTGIITVWDGASENTIFGDAEVNYAFRAWHDWCHITYKLPFTLEGETRAVEAQAEHLLALYGDSPRTRRWIAILRCEVLGQFEYLLQFGDFPVDQAAFTRACAKTAA